MRNVDPEIRFWLNVRSGPGCWEWQGARKGGRMRYGTIRVGREIPTTHRYSWIIHFGPIPDGLFVCHKCDNPICVRPDHLFLGTNLDNTRDRDMKGRNVNLLGEQHGRSVMSDAVAAELRREYDSSPVDVHGRKMPGTIPAIAERHGLTLSAVENVVWRRTRVLT